MLPLPGNCYYFRDDHFDQLRCLLFLSLTHSSAAQLSLALFSFVYFPIFLIMCWAEERDLILRYGDAYIAYYRKTGAFFPKTQR
jgi:protein-S-isoprenylcysteine O-methyltransferase Ste14